MHGEPRPGAPSPPGRDDPGEGHDPSGPLSRAGFFERVPDAALARRTRAWSHAVLGLPGLG